MKTISVEYQDDDLDIKLEIGEANVRMGMHRSLLIDKVTADLERSGNGASEDLEKAALDLLAVKFYPAFIAGVISHEGFDHWPVTFEEYIELPEMLCIKWENAVFTLNPHWAISLPVLEDLGDMPKDEREEAEKKAKAPSTE